MDLLKAFDCLSHDLLVGKSNVSGFSITAIRLAYNDLANYMQKT